MYGNQSRWVKHLDFIILDMIVVAAAYFLSVVWWLHMSVLQNSAVYRSTIFVLVLAAAVLDIVFSFLTDVLKRSSVQEMISTA